MEEQFLYFIQIASCGNFTQAAQRLYISQPALSKYIHRLEQQLHVKLFQRTNNKLELTKAGEYYFAYAKEMYERYQKMKKDLAQLSAASSEKISLGMGADMSRFYLEDILNLSAKLPWELEIEMVEDTSLHLAKRLEQQWIDFALFYTDTPACGNQTSKVLKKEPIYFICKKEHPLLKEKKPKKRNGDWCYDLTKEEMQNQLFYERNKNYKLTEVVHRFLSERNLLLSQVASVEDLDTMYYLVKSTKRFGFFPAFYLEKAARKEEVSLCTIEGEVPQWYLVLSQKAERACSPAVSAWVDAVEAFYTKAE